MRGVCYAVFFVSGAAALVYQVAWQRMLAIFSGADVYSATIIVAAFMAGLGIGSLAGGHVADRVSARASLVLFGAAELAVALFGASSATLYYDLLYARLGEVAIPAPALAALLFVSLLSPTFLMGASLPLLARALTRHLEGAASTVGMLYGLNTAGAAAGAMAVTWWLLPRLGLEGSLAAGAVLNASAAAVVLPFALLRVRPAPDVEGPQAPAFPSGGGALPFGAWVAIYAFSGFLALSLEIVWFRTIGVMMKATAFTFGTLLALYLAGLGLGSMAGGTLARRIRRPGPVFLNLQAAAGLCATGLLAVFVFASDEIRSVQGYLGSYEPVNVPDSVKSLRALAASVIGAGATPEGTPANFLRFYVAVPFALVVPATFLMGCSFPVLQRIVQTDLAMVGRRLGLLLVANIGGSVAGAMLTGWVLLDVLGTPATFRLVAAASAGFALLAVRLARLQAPPGGAPWRRARTAPVAIALSAAGVAIVLLLPAGRGFWARLHGTTPDRVLVAEDGSGLAVIKLERPEPDARQVVFVNGLGQSELPYGGIHTALGAVPAFLHPSPRAAMVIGLGSGDTVHAMAGRLDLERIVCVEIVGPQIASLRQLARQSPYGGLQSLLRNPRIEHAFGDGRSRLMRGGTSYDIIEADALRPGSAYAGNLYSEEYFALVRSRLAPGGLAATWAPTRRVYDTFVRVFPWVVSVPGMLIGSDAPIDVDLEAILERVSAPAVRQYYAAAGIDIEQVMREYFAAPAFYTPDFDRAGLDDINTDLFPRDEYDLERP